MRRRHTAWLGFLLLASVLVGTAGSATAVSYPADFDPAWDLAVPNHGGGAVATGERWTVIGGPQHGPGVRNEPATFDYREYVLVVSEPDGDVVETLVGSDTQPGDRFGFDVAVSGDRVAVGAPDADGEQGAAYVFTFGNGAPAETKILPESGEFGFGSRVALDGTRLVVLEHGGEAAVFDLNDDTWERTDLTALAAEGIGGPPSVAVDGDTVVVGRSGAGDRGVIAVYTKTAQGWTGEQLIASDLNDVFGYPGFGAAVDVAGDCVIAGAPNTFVGGGYMGGAYVYCRSGSGWTESKLAVPEQTDDDGFGSAVALLGPYYAVVGAPKHDTGEYNSGSVYVFANDGGSWNRVATLQAPAGHIGEEGHFGAAVDVIRGRLVVGASGPSEPSAAGEAFSFTGPFDGWFLDDDTSVFADDIEWLAAAGITRGCDPPFNLKFCPGAGVTRGQMAAFLVRALELTDDGFGNLFIDDDDSIFETDIDKLATAGITRGCNPPVNTRFCPERNVTRGQMAAFLVRALDLIDDGGGDLFIDDDESIFESDIDKLATAGVTRGCNPPVNDRFCPSAYVTRGQMAAFLHRALGLPLALVAEPLPWGKIGHAYDGSVRAIGGFAPYEFRMTAGQLPDGLTFASTGRISGTPLVDGSTTVTVAVTDRRGTEAEGAVELYIAADALIGFTQITPLGGGRSSSEICTVEPDGTNERCMPELGSIMHAMTWSPDQSQIAFTGVIDGRTDLFLVDFDGSNLVRITHDTATERNPAFSPDGTQIAFARSSNSQTDIWVIDIDGKNATQLTFDGRGIRGPTWSPDGSSIAFATWRDDEDYNTEIYVMDADGSNQRPLIRRDTQDLNPDWSSDGSLITFDTHGHDLGHSCNAVFVVDADGTNPRFVACGVQPAFSPDGTEIVYSTWYDRPGTGGIEPADLFVVGIDGSNPRCVSCSAFTTEENPDW